MTTIFPRWTRQAAGSYYLLDDAGVDWTITWNYGTRRWDLDRGWQCQASLRTLEAAKKTYQKTLAPTPEVD